MKTLVTKRQNEACNLVLIQFLDEITLFFMLVTVQIIWLMRNKHASQRYWVLYASADKYQSVFCFCRTQLCSISRPSYHFTDVLNILLSWEHYYLDYKCSLSDYQNIFSFPQTIKSWLYSFINSLQPNDAIWQHRSGSTVAQVMFCCLMMPSHYLIQCWLVISKVSMCPSKSIMITMAKCKTAVTPLLTHWSYCSLALSH